jgi:hypothetical protein
MGGHIHGRSRWFKRNRGEARSRRSRRKVTETSVSDVANRAGSTEPPPASRSLDRNCQGSSPRYNLVHSEASLLAHRSGC